MRNTAARKRTQTRVDEESVLSSRAADTDRRSVSNTSVGHVDACSRRRVGGRGVRGRRVVPTSAAAGAARVVMVVVVMFVTTPAQLMEGSRPVGVDALHDLLRPGSVAGEDLLGMVAGDAAHEWHGARGDEGRHRA